MSSTKKIKQSDLTQALVKKVLRYDPILGTLIWISGLHSKRVVPNSRAGTLTKSGYRQVTLYGTTYREHRLIWFMETGEWPEEVDHEDQDRSNNKWSNLRAVTKAENSRNRSRNPHGKLGEVGIWYNKRTFKYVAEITVNGKKVYQKSFSDIDEAIEARKAKSLELGFHDNHGNKPTGK